MHLENENQAADVSPLADVIVTAAFPGARGPGLRVRQPDGSVQPLSLEQLKNLVADVGSELNAIDISALAQRVHSGLYDGIDQAELDRLLVQASADLIAEDPQYAQLAARFLDHVILGEVRSQGIVSMADSIVHGHGHGIIADDVKDFVLEHADVLDAAIVPKRAKLFRYFGLQTLCDRYLLRHPTSGKVIETPQYFFMRVACGLARKPEEAIEFYQLLSSLEYLPSSHTLSNSGTRHPQMSSSYLLDSPADELEGIYKQYADIARLSKFSGGIGTSWTRIRSQGSRIKGGNGRSNGIIPWLKTLDASVAAVQQGEHRADACCVYLETWHADIEAFLELRDHAGADAHRTHNLNLANWVSDLFMRRVQADGMWSLFDPKDTPDLVDTYGEEFTRRFEQYEAEGMAVKQLRARALYDRMMQTLVETGNGWMTFKDHCNHKSNQTGLPHNVVHSSNLSTEIIECTDHDEPAVCNLGSINLSRFVRHGAVDFEALASRVRVAVKYLDRVVDITEYPTTEASASNSRWRPVGLGLMGLQDVFFQLRISFDSPEASELSARIQEEVYFAALTTSADLAEAHGAHPSFHETRAAAGHLQFDLWGVTPSSMGPGKQVSLFGTSASSTDRWAKLRQRIQVVGLRNSLLVAIAPTTAIAAISECYECTEPQVSNLVQRETLSGSFLQINRYLVEDLKRLDLWTPQLRALIEEAKGSIQGIQEVPEALRTLYRTAWELPQQALIDMAAARSPYIDQSASLNLFLAEPTIAELSSMYAYAWKKGLKTTYYLRSHRQTPSADDALLTDEDTVSSASVAVSSPAAELRADTPPSTATEQELSATGPAALTADAGSPYPNALSQFVVTRSYLRWREEDGRRETYAEAVSRYCDFVSGARDVPPSVLQDIREGMLSMGVLPSMRALWSAGPAAGRDNTMIYNCSFLPLDNLRAFGEMLYILMMGTGVGYSVEREFVANLPAVAPRSGRMIPYTIADSTVGWADAVFDGLTHMWQGHTVDFDYSLIRPEGARCKTKGGRASGPKPLRLLLEFCQGVIDTASGRQLRSIEVSDIACMIGEIVKAGGVRRAALICFSDPEDDAMRHAKDWRRGSFPECRYMANISAFWSSKPKRKVFDREWDALRNSGSGERGFYMVPSKRREERQGELRSNPCGEILLRYAKAECPWTGRGGGGQFCNLSAAVLRQEDTRESFAAKIRTATWIGALQASFTNFPYLRPAWKQHCNEDRLLGVDITGHCDNPALSNDTEAMTYFNQVALETAAAASKHLGISMPASVTCGKPSGNSSQAVDCASGFHTRYADFYIRRVRVSANDPLYHLVRDSGAPVFKDVKYKNGPDEDCPTWVVEFPVKAPEGCMTRDDETALEQLARYLHIMRTWCSERGHNQSATVYVREDEWGPVGDWLYEHFDEVTGLSFLPYDGGKYELAPYEEITEAEYLSRVRDFPVLDYKLLSQYETEDMGQGAQTLACVGGSCEIDYETLTPAEDAAQ